MRHPAQVHTNKAHKVFPLTNFGHRDLDSGVSRLTPCDLHENNVEAIAITKISLRQIDNLSSGHSVS